MIFEEILCNCILNTNDRDPIRGDKNVCEIYVSLFKHIPDISTIIAGQTDENRNLIDNKKSLKSIESYTNWSRIVVVYGSKLFISIEEHLIIRIDYLSNAYSHFSVITIYSSPNYYKTYLENRLVYRDKQTHCVSYVIRYPSGSVNCQYLDITSVKYDPNKYNNDIPHNKIIEFIKSDHSGVAIFNGMPGTGKTFYIRSLITENPDTDFIYLDSSWFDYITDSCFLNYILEHKESVIILEDCETLLQDRATSNQKISTLLNISDGIIGDSLKLKFICTFNSDLTTIDKAILRKGRLKIKYEFKKLKADKVQALGKELGKNLPNEDMALCDIFNYEEDNNRNQVNRPNKIGF